MVESPLSPYERVVEIVYEMTGDAGQAVGIANAIRAAELLRKTRRTPWRPKMDDPFDNTPGMVVSDPRDTSAQSAVDVEPSTGTQRRRVYDAIVAAKDYGITDHELQVDLKMPGNTQRPRRLELEEGGLIRDSGMRRKSQGRDHIVWVARTT